MGSQCPPRISKPMDMTKWSAIKLLAYDFVSRSVSCKLRYVVGGIYN